MHFCGGDDRMNGTLSILYGIHFKIIKKLLLPKSYIEFNLYYLIDIGG